MTRTSRARAIARLIAVVALVGASACGDGETTGSVTDSGIEGLTVSGPQCPVEVAGSPCPDAPISVELYVTKRGSSEVVATATSNQKGEFRFLLAPGEYTVHPASPSGPPTAGPQDVTVRAHSFTEITFEFDSGIR